jgi:hypothetical protein
MNQGNSSKEVCLRYFPQVRGSEVLVCEPQLSGVMGVVQIEEDAIDDLDRQFMNAG